MPAYEYKPQKSVKTQPTPEDWQFAYDHEPGCHQLSRTLPEKAIEWTAVFGDSIAQDLDEELAKYQDRLIDAELETLTDE